MLPPNAAVHPPLTLLHTYRHNNVFHRFLLLYIFPEKYSYTSALGYQTKASNSGATALGYQSKATGLYSTA